MLQVLVITDQGLKTVCQHGVELRTKNGNVRWQCSNYSMARFFCFSTMAYHINGMITVQMPMGALLEGFVLL